MTPTPFSFVAISLALETDDFVELDGSVGQYTYFRHHDGRIVQVDRNNELTDSQLREIADQAQIASNVFMARISAVRKYLQDQSDEK